MSRLTRQRHSHCPSHRLRRWIYKDDYRAVCKDFRDAYIGIFGSVSLEKLTLIDSIDRGNVNPYQYLCYRQTPGANQRPTRLEAIVSHHAQQSVNKYQEFHAAHPNICIAELYNLAKDPTHQSSVPAKIDLIQISQLKAQSL